VLQRKVEQRFLSASIAGIAVLRLVDPMVAMRRGMPIGTNERRQQKGNSARCGYASC
jgi:hypothetical protein